MSYVKLDCCILNSSLWINFDGRGIFITALLMAEPMEFTEPQQQIAVRSFDHTGFIVPPGWYGFIAASSLGIIRQAGMEREAGMAALEYLGAPEPESRSQDFGGRRLVRIDGGFILLNYIKYREKDHTAKDRQRRFRDRQRSKHNAVASVSNAVTSRNITHADADADADANSNAKNDGGGGAVTARAEKQTEPPAQPPPAADLFDGEKIQDIPPIERKTFGDFQAMHGRLYVGKGERDAWEAILATWGWDPCHEAYGACLALLKNAGHRIQLSMMTRYLDDNFVLKGTP